MPPLGRESILDYQMSDRSKEIGVICDDRDICSPDRVHAKNKYDIDSDTYHEYAMKVELDCIFVQVCNTRKTHCNKFRKEIWKIIDKDIYS